MRTLDRATLIAHAAATALASAACNTVAGVGRDVESVGQAVAGAAEETEDELKEGTP